MSDPAEMRVSNFSLVTTSLLQNSVRRKGRCAANRMQVERSLENPRLGRVNSASSYTAGTSGDDPLDPQ